MARSRAAVGTLSGRLFASNVYGKWQKKIPAEAGQSLLLPRIIMHLPGYLSRRKPYEDPREAGELILSLGATPPGNSQMP